MSPLQASLSVLRPTHGGGWAAVGETHYPGVHILRTEDASYRFVDGVCFGATRADGAPLPHAVGRRLIGWIVPRPGGAIALVPSPHDAPARAPFVLFREGGGGDAFVVSGPTAETDLPAPRPAPSGVQLRAVSVRRPDPTSLTRIHTLSARSR